MTVSFTVPKTTSQKKKKSVLLGASKRLSAGSPPFSHLTRKHCTTYAKSILFTGTASKAQILTYKGEEKSETCLCGNMEREPQIIRRVIHTSK